MDFNNKKIKKPKRTEKKSISNESDLNKNQETISPIKTPEKMIMNSMYNSFFKTPLSVPFDPNSALKYIK